MLHAQIDITGMLWIAKGLDFVQCVKVHQDDMETIRCIIQKWTDMSKKRTMQIDVIEEVKGTQFMQCKLYIDGNASVILMNKIDYERLLSDSFFVRDGKNRDSAGVLNTTNTFLEKD